MEITVTGQTSGTGDSDSGSNGNSTSHHSESFRLTCFNAGRTEISVAAQLQLGHVDTLPCRSCQPLPTGLHVSLPQHDLHGTHETPLYVT